MFSRKQFLVTVAVSFCCFLTVLSYPASSEDDEASIMKKREDLLRALYELQAGGAVDNTHNMKLYRASRSMGKPTFIRFGKRAGYPRWGSAAQEIVAGPAVDPIAA
ncbi:hypothetical protein AAVH_30556 [Aphelenchoides avenae]|nr:hypothetical protein AAVH_30556 [Aphelenchus avenae]